LNIQGPIVHSMNQRHEALMGFREGQLFIGKVMKILPYGMAEVTVNWQKIVAKLETSLQAGERYWFHVSSIQDGIRLKVLSSPSTTKGEDRDIAANLLRHLSIPETAENKAVLTKAIKEQWPVTKEMIMRAGEWLREVDMKEGIHVIKLMLDKSLPFTRDVFSSLHSIQSAKSFTSLLGELTLQLNGLTEPTEAARKLHHVLEQSNRQSFQFSMVQRLFSSFINMLGSAQESHEGKAAVIEVFKSWGLIPKHINSAQETFQALAENWLKKRAGEAEPAVHPILREVSQVIRQWAGNPTSHEALESLQRLLISLIDSSNVSSATQAYQNEVKTLAGNLLNGQGNPPQLGRIFEIVLKGAAGLKSAPEAALLNLSYLMNTSPDGLVNLLQNELSRIEAASLTRQSQTDVFLHQSILAIENSLRDSMRGGDVLSLFKRTFQLIGIDFESVLVQGGKESGEWEESLKVQLLRLMNEQVPPHIKETAEQLIGRINAQHLLSGETGPIQQLVMQMPINLFGWKTDLTIQWSGKKNSDGKLNPDYCRVLFYLHLKNIKETVVDMQVQNKIITVQVYNEFSAIKQLADPLIPALKAYLSEIGYQLSGVQFKMSHEGTTKNTVIHLQEEQSYSGVDIRI